MMWKLPPPMMIATTVTVVLMVVMMIQPCLAFFIQPPLSSSTTTTKTTSTPTTHNQRHPFLGGRHRSSNTGPLYDLDLPPDPLTTPFEAGFYTNPGGVENVFQEYRPPLKVPNTTQLVLGINKYSHDATICAADVETGKVLFALSKERLTRMKHDSGPTTNLVTKCMECLDLDINDNVHKVVVNNHHHRILPLEGRSVEELQWESYLRMNEGQDEEQEAEENILPHVNNKLELSHHLAHAYSTATQAPFDSGLVIVMDGMGETFRTMMQATKDDGSSYISDLSFGLDTFQTVPSNIQEHVQNSIFDWREAESVYKFKKIHDNGDRPPTMDIYPIFKRFQKEHTPPTLYNHGFLNMDSLGAIYSRVAMHIFGDWNVCGKVMGLAPWMGHIWTNTTTGENFTATPIDDPIISGKLYDEDSIIINRTLLMGQPMISRNDPELFDPITGIRKRRYDFDNDDGTNMPTPPDLPNEPELDPESYSPKFPTKVALDAISLSHRIQCDLEKVGMDFIQHFVDKEGEDTNLCLAGGVALNSVLNGRIARDINGVKQTFISPYPGDDGIAVGCCAYGLYGNLRLDNNDNDEKVQQSKATKEDDNDDESTDKKRTKKKKQSSPPLWSGPLSPYLGPEFTEIEIKLAIERAKPWLDVDTIRNEDKRCEMMVQEMESGGIIAWYHGRSEIGPRALGHRSILADPRAKGLVRFINQHVKKRETFRPFAPSVLAEEAKYWFEGVEGKQDDDNMSPYMSMTAMVKESKREVIPAVTHAGDGSSRLQTVTEESDPLYYKLIQKFFERTKVPMVLNTSFNTLKGEPIVETPSDAIRSFLCSMGSMEVLVMGDYIIRRKDAPIRALLGEVTRDDARVLTDPTCPIRTGNIHVESTFDLYKTQLAGDRVIPTGPGSEEEQSSSDVITTTRVMMPDRPMHHSKHNAWFTLIDELEGELLGVCDGTNTLNDILGHYTARQESPDGPDVDIFKKKDYDESKELVEYITRRLMRLYDHTLISW